MSLERMYGLMLRKKLISSQWFLNPCFVISSLIDHKYSFRYIVIWYASSIALGVDSEMAFSFRCISEMICFNEDAIQFIVVEHLQMLKQKIMSISHFQNFFKFVFCLAITNNNSEIDI